MPPEDHTPSDAYDELADSYEAELESNPYNEHLDFPATTSLVPDVAGDRVLDAGCGGGRYTEWLLEEGADVVGVDASAEMLAHANDRVGDNATLHQADLADPLEFVEEGAFDGVVSGLALSYVEDWRAVFAEFARVLRPGGFLVFSTTHPFDEYPLSEESNYFKVERTTKEWDVEVPYYRRPVGEMLNPLLETGFRLDEVLEPQPTEAFREAWPERYEKESKRPVFFCVRAVFEG
ncbi:class I SAM-dependent methyltransferase [Halobacteriales archaeon Cl-PHB]